MTTITVTIWHNVARDQQDRHTGMLEGYHPGDPMVRVFTYQADPAGLSPEEIAEEAFAIGNGHPSDARGADLARRYYERELRSLSVGDLVVAGEAALVCERAGWARLRGGITEARIDEHGTHPLPAGGPPDSGSPQWEQGDPTTPSRSWRELARTLPGELATPRNDRHIANKISRCDEDG
jgi:hypothetical protein